MTKRVIALAWAVDPLAFSVFFPPQSTFPNNAPAVELPPAALGKLPPAVLLALFSLEHPDKSSAPVAKTLSAAPNRLGFNSVPSYRDEAGSTVGMKRDRRRPSRGTPTSHLSQP
jgi:hypothetical protein